ncbi:hypothetical protein ACFCYN_20280 [Gottfriedia sp. NPDC056225]|uniref:hypothetical protein n=1 Tax=Gottfriedia sp. NPDC056225 TaxID=3345751 RepID=UPI0035E0294C
MQFGKILLLLGLILFVLAIPIANLLGGMATGGPDVPWWKFWEAFFIAETIPILMILIGIVIMIIISWRRRKIEEDDGSY